MKESEARYLKGCQASDLTSCLGQAKLYRSGRLPGDPIKLLDEACARGVSGVCLAKDIAQLSAELGCRSPARLIESLVRACEQGDPMGCLELGRSRRDRSTGSVTAASVVEPLRKACTAGVIAACHEGLLVDSSERPWFEARACFRSEAMTCDATPGLEIAKKTIELKWSSTGRSFLYTDLQFTGPDGHSLLASWGAETALIDLSRGAVAARVTLSSPRRRGPYSGGGDLVRSIERATWEWSASAGVVGLIELSGYGHGFNQGFAVWSPASGDLPKLVRPTTGSMSLDEKVMALSPDLRFAVIGIDSEVVLLDLQTGSEIGAPIEIYEVKTAAFSADSSTVAIGAENGAIAVVATATGARSMLKASSATVRSLSFHPTRRLLAAADERDHIRIWQLDATDRVPRPMDEQGRIVSFSPDGRYLALSGGQLVLLDATTLLRVARPVPCSACSSRTSLVFSPDSRYVASAGTHEATLFELGTRAAAPVAADSAWFTKLHRLPIPEAPPSPPFARDATIRGKITMEGKPVAGAKIEIKPSLGEWPNARTLPPRVTRSAKDGSYTFQGIPEINWSVEVTSQGAQRGVRDLRLRKSGDSNRSADETSFNLERGFSVRGKVLDAAGRPAPGARISLGYLEVVADGQGKFTLHHLSQRWNLQLRAYRADGSVVIEELGKGGTGLPQEVVLRLRAPSDPRVLRLKIVDAQGKPMPNLWLSVGSNSMGKTDARGMFFTDIGSERSVSPSLNSMDGLWLSQSITLPQPNVVTLTAKPLPNWE